MIPEYAAVHKHRLTGLAARLIQFHHVYVTGAGPVGRAVLVPAAGNGEEIILPVPSDHVAAVGERKVEHLACRPLALTVNVHMDSGLKSLESREKAHHGKIDVLVFRYRHEAHHTARTVGHEAGLSGGKVLQIHCGGGF